MVASIASSETPACRIVPLGSFAYACWRSVSSLSFWRKLAKSPPFPFMLTSRSLDRPAATLTR